MKDVKFKVGDKVRIKATSAWYGNGVYNPKDEVGVVLECATVAPEFGIRVQWKAGTNSYCAWDLEVVEEKAMFKVGDKVKISVDSEYYGNGWRTNPKDEVGTVIEVRDKHYAVQVQWKDTYNNYRTCDLELVETAFSKADLRSGMRVELRNKMKYIVFVRGEDVVFSGPGIKGGVDGCYMDGNDFRPDLTLRKRAGDNEWDVMKVYDVSRGDFGNHSLIGSLVWERKERKEKTTEQLELEEVQSQIEELQKREKELKVEVSRSGAV